MKRSLDPGTAWHVRRDLGIAPGIVASGGCPNSPRPSAPASRSSARWGARSSPSTTATPTSAARTRPGEIASALVGRKLTKAHRRGKFLWAETDDGGPDLGLHLGMAGRIVVDEPAGENNWDRFVLEFADGGRMALRDKRRLGRAVVEPDFAHVGPDAAEVSRDVFRERVGRGTMRAEGAAARPALDRGRRQPARRRDAVAGADLPAPPGGLADRGGTRPPAPRPARRHPLRDPQGRRPHRRLHPPPQARRGVPALRDHGRARHDRRAHDVLVPELPALRLSGKSLVALQGPQVTWSSGEVLSDHCVGRSFRPAVSEDDS